VVLAESARQAGDATRADLIDILRLAVYWAWGWAVWKSSRNVARPVWTPLARIAIVAGLAPVALL